MTEVTQAVTPTVTPVVKQRAAANSLAPLPTVDILDDSVIWTPEIECLVQAVVEQIRIDQPGMIVNGPQRNGKSRACRYVAAVLSESIGYPVTTFIWSMPKDIATSSRGFFQERMFQSGCNAVSHRDIVVVKNRFFNHIAERASAEAARRVVIIVDEAQNLGSDDYGSLVFIFNELERRHVRPFILLVGQPELSQISELWLSQDAQQMIGRFSTRTHDYLGIALDDLEQVLEGFDNDEDGPQSSPAFRTAPAAYADGWRIVNLAPLMREAVQTVVTAQNVNEQVRLPMQYLRSCLLAMLYRIIQRRIRPEALTLADAVDCVKATNFAKVLQYYVRKGKGTSGASSGARAQ